MSTPPPPQAHQQAPRQQPAPSAPPQAPDPKAASFANGALALRLRGLRLVTSLELRQRIRSRRWYVALGVWTVALMVIGLVILLAAIAVQKRFVDRPWDPAPARLAPAAATATTATPGASGAAVAAGAPGAADAAPARKGSSAPGRYPRIAPPAGAPTPPPPPASE